MGLGQCPSHPERDLHLQEKRPARSWVHALERTRIKDASRPDIYARVLETPEFLVDLYHESAGFLVNDISHHSFDRYEWSFFPEGDRLIVHFFKPLTAQDT